MAVTMIPAKVLKLEERGNSQVYNTGRAVMADRDGVVLFGMSPGNPYFKSSVIEDYVGFLGQEKRLVAVVVPQQPAEHTYKAMGSKDAVKRARKNANQLRSHCRRAIEKVREVGNMPLEFESGHVVVRFLLKNSKLPPERSAR